MDWKEILQSQHFQEKFFGKCTNFCWINCQYRLFFCNEIIQGLSDKAITEFSENGSSDTGTLNECKGKPKGMILHLGYVPILLRFWRGRRRGRPYSSTGKLLNCRKKCWQNSVDLQINITIGSIEWKKNHYWLLSFLPIVNSKDKVVPSLNPINNCTSFVFNREILCAIEFSENFPVKLESFKWKYHLRKSSQCNCWISFLSLEIENNSSEFW